MLLLLLLTAVARWQCLAVGDERQTAGQGQATCVQEPVGLSVDYEQRGVSENR